ncbi:hypothetical protein SHI21_18240 [Bacteriovorax sp. PP10]|uniref:Uncharacterized protein n=1 Tax=Bacteriovorax antarcticus TaxID=3088717 RepID=A0ABU5VYN0_9BACT|nr:hypothetical protein [Bacteriovorax sp. PP10]MEA9358180.1 hypothetical protein [Bacteriovorax sp. PP10]
MNNLMIGAVAGGLSGAVGHFLAGKFHGNEKGQKIYPVYSATFFGLMVLGAKFIAV